MAWLPSVKRTVELVFGRWVLNGAKCILLPWNFGFGGVYKWFTTPRRDGWQLRPPPPESLAFGRGRRHISYVAYDIFDMLFLFREAKCCQCGGQLQVNRCYNYMGKCLKLAVMGKGLHSYCYVVVERYNDVH